MTNGDRRAVRIRRVPGAAGGFGHPAERVPQQGHGRSEDRALAGAGSGGERGLPLHPRRQVRGHGVEALPCECVRVFGDLPGRAVRHSHAARPVAAQPRRDSRDVLGSRVQHRRQLRDEHELAGVQRRERAQLLLPGDRPDGAELRHARRGLGRFVRAVPRHRERRESGPRKLLGRCDARGAVRAHPAVACGDDDRRAAGLAAEFQRVRDGAAAGAGRRDR